MKYIFIDIDGTLIGSFDHHIPESTIKAITKAKQNGHKIFLCTGRPLSQVEMFKSDLFNGMICSAGCYAEINSKVLFERIMSDEDMKRIMATLDEYGINYILEGKIGNYYLEEGRETFMELFKHYDANMKWEDIIENLGLFTMDLMTKDVIYKITYYTCDKELINKVKKDLSDSFQMVYTDRGEGNMVEVEIMYNDCNKAEGIKQIIEHFGATMDDTIAFGDSMNDYEMIQECSVGVAMGNACDALKEVADHVTTHVLEDGIFNAFEKFELI